MQLLVVLFILTCTDAKRRRPATLKMEIENPSSYPNPDDIDTNESQKSVDFGHIYRDPTDSRNSKLHDRSDSDMEKPNIQIGRDMLAQVSDDINWVRNSDKPLGFISPRDSTLYYEKHKKPSDINTNQNEKESLNRPMRVKSPTGSMWINFPLLQQKNISPPDYRSPSNHQTKSRKEEPIIPAKYGRIMNQNDTIKYFSRQGFDLVEEKDNAYKNLNWTTCKEFAKGAKFHPDDIINLEWMPFYTWSTRGFDTSNIHKFTYPTKKLVEEYRKKYDPYLLRKVDWEQPKLLMKEIKDTLLIAGDRKGLFYCIPYIDLPSSLKDVKIPVITMRLKIVDTYLAMMYCDEPYATIMAVSGEGPVTFEDKTVEAAILKFTGGGNPVARDLEEERRRAKNGREQKRKEEERKYINVERDIHRFDI